MGLGKTIMVAALIQTNQPRQSNGSAVQGRAASSSASADETNIDDDDNEIGYVPSSVSKQPLQTKLISSVNNTNEAVARRLRAGRHNATLVIAPTSLLNQWKVELLRSCNSNLNVLVYNDQKDTGTLVQELDGGVDIVVASYGKLGVEYEKYASEDGKGFAKRPREGIYAVDWFRVILDEVSRLSLGATPSLTPFA